MRPALLNCCYMRGSSNGVANVVLRVNFFTRKAHQDSLPEIISRSEPDGRPSAVARVWALRWRRRWSARLGFIGTADAIPVTELRQKVRCISTRGHHDLINESVRKMFQILLPQCGLDICPFLLCLYCPGNDSYAAMRVQFCARKSSAANGLFAKSVCVCGLFFRPMFHGSGGTRLCKRHCVQGQFCESIWTKLRCVSINRAAKEFSALISGRLDA